MTPTNRRTAIGPAGFAYATAVLALVLTFSGGAYAAALIGGADVRDGSITGADIKDGSLRSRDVRDESLQGRDVRNHTIQKQDLAAGVAVAPGATVPAGTLLRGVLAPVTGTALPEGTDAGHGVSFGWALPSRPRAHVVVPGGSRPAACGGSVTSPTAARGHLCVYLRFVYDSATQVLVTDVAGNLPGINYNLDTNHETVHGDGRVSRLGFRFATVATSNVAQMEGTWAVRG